ncbi:MAG: tetratricopeptide repeat protein [Bacteroidota bacterium]
MRQAQLLLILLLSLSSSGLLAQAGSVSAAEVNFEKDFIEAKREALVGKTDKAIAAFKALIDKAPDQDVLYFELGRLYFTQEENNDAVEVLEKAYQLNPSPVYAQFLGELYLTTGQNKEGAKLYADLIQNQPTEADYYLQRALFLVRAQNIDKAIDVYNELEQQIGVNAELSRRKHALYLGQGDKKRAEKELTKLIAAFPNILEYRHLLAGFYTSQQNAAAAKRTYQDILRIEPADVKAQLALQSENPTDRQGNSSELMNLFSRADVAVDLKVGKLLPLVQAVATQKDVNIADEGLVLAAELRRVHPDEAKGWAITGDLYYHSSRYAEAATAYEKTLTLDDTVYPVWEQLLHALYLDNQQQALSKQAENALDVFPNRPYVYFYAAMAAAARLDYDEAVGLMQQAVFIFGAAKPSAANMANSYLTALESLTSGELPPPNELINEADAFGTYLRALRLMAKQDYTATIKLLESVDHERNTNASQLEILGDAYLADGQKDKAATLFQRAKAAGSMNSKLNAKITQTRS